MLQPQGWKPVQEAEFDQDPIFEVKDILNSRGSRKDEEPLVHWKVLPASAATWEPLAYLGGCKDLLMAFRASKTRRRPEINT